MPLFLIHFENLENEEMPQSIGLMMSETDVLRKSPLMNYLQRRGRNNFQVFRHQFDVLEVVS